ncbi:MAG TPA: LysR family transcriptional regulator [Firmicutes bacterium]|jgi:DNA-binding transcriptional LysR family regulator|nr:LysR family transcriptional regulator [Bacillota bacterium]
MDFHQLKIFIEVARQKNFSRAAENIFLSQPTVSAHIKALENEIGVPLIDRSQRELQLTEAGKVLLKYARQLQGIKDEALFAIQQESRIVKGHLEIAASSVPGAYILPWLMKSFLEKHPGVTFAVLLRDTRQVYNNIRDYTYDLGFVGEPAAPDGLDQIMLLGDELVLVAAPDICLSDIFKSKSKPGSQFYEIDLSTGINRKNLLRIPFIMREPGSATRIVFENALQKFYGKKKVPLNIVAYLESQEAIKEAVKAGLGVTAISCKAVNEELSSGSMQGYRLPDLHLKRNFYLIYHKNRIFSILNQAFLDHCIDHFQPGASF